MKFAINKVRGTYDVLPGESAKWDFFEETLRKCGSFMGFETVRPPVIEHTELFERSSGETSDVVQKEMYTFEDKGGRSVTLRPEFTAGVLRAFLEGGMMSSVLPSKLMYFGPCFRYEKPQSGRFREFFQFGAEIFGGNSVMADAELIFLAGNIFSSFGIKNLELQINSVGCHACRPKYKEILVSYFEKNRNSLCPLCIERLEKNPLRIFDCKNEGCRKIYIDAPQVISSVCADCASDFEKFKALLDSSEIKYYVNPRMVRGLDYYTKLVFEFVSCEDSLTVCGGGRYDGLSAELGGPELSATGFGIGAERLISVAEMNGFIFPKKCSPSLYIMPLGANAQVFASELTYKLRMLGVRVEIDLVGRGAKSQMRYADKIGCKFMLPLGSEEIFSGISELKRMSDGTVFKIKLEKNLIDELYSYLN
jgi:histidyl-tRNA synthetase